MKPIKTENKGNYRIDTFSHYVFEAIGSGLSGKIRFGRGSKSKCSFLIENRDYDDPELRRNNLPRDGMPGRYCAIVKGGDKPVLHLRGANGEMHVCPEKDCCGGSIRTAVAHAPVSVMFSKISSGAKNSGYFSPKDENGDISLPALYLALITMGEEDSSFCNELIEAINMHPKHPKKFVNWTTSGYKCKYKQFRRFAGKWLFDLTNKGGSKALKEASILSGKIENKIRRHEKTELDFLDAISKAATKIFDVPTQKEVREIWMDCQAGRTEKQFRDIRIRLGFNWLPTATRGKNAH